jgi:hypothetical protein
MQTNSIPYVLGSDSITVYLKGKPYPINKQAHTYPMVLAAIKSGDVNALEQAINIRQGIVNNLTKTNKSVRIDGSRIFYDEREVTGLVASRVFETIRLGLDTAPITNFLGNLMLNPSKRAVDESMGFIEACDLPLTEDGFFLAYKRVNATYFDVHSSTVLNKPAELMTAEDRITINGTQGKQSEVKVELINGVTTVSMPRNLVNEDRDQTCSEGLHFCSFSYLSSFRGARIVILKINPADIVSIPSDYNNSKGRTCKYQVVGEVDLGLDTLPTTKLDSGYTTKFGTKPVVAPVIINPDVLSDVNIRYIRKCLLTGAETVSMLAKQFKRSERTIRRIRDYEAYKHVA